MIQYAFNALYIALLVIFVFAIGFFAGIHKAEDSLRRDKVDCEVIEYKSNGGRVTVVRVGTVLKLAEKLKF